MIWDQLENFRFLFLIKREQDIYLNLYIENLDAQKKGLIIVLSFFLQIPLYKHPLNTNTGVYSGQFRLLRQKAGIFSPKLKHA